MSAPFPRLLSGTLLHGLLLPVVAVSGLVLPGPGALAQSQRFLLSPGNRGKVGPSTTVTPENCVTAADGSVTCDTKLVNPPGDTPAKPQFSPFSQ